MDQPLLERCPFCDYRLEGLPVKHVCPECGQAFDRRWRVFGGRSPWRAMSPAERWQFCIAVAACSGLVLFAIVSRTVPALILGVAGWVAGMTFILMGHARPHGFVVVERDGVTICRRRPREWTHYSWSDLDLVRVTDRGYLAIRVADDECVFDLGSRAEAGRCAQCIETVRQGGDMSSVSSWTRK